MSASLPPQYFGAGKRYRSAREPEEKIAALQAMLAIMPRYKGTDKLHAELRRKIARFSQEAERKYATAGAGFSDNAILDVHPLRGVARMKVDVTL
jgi:hypothetical protein